MGRRPKSVEQGQAPGYPTQQGIVNDQNVTPDRMRELNEWIHRQDSTTQMNFLTMVDMVCTMPAQYLKIVDQCPDPIMKRHLYTAIAVRAYAEVLSGE